MNIYHLQLRHDTDCAEALFIKYWELDKACRKCGKYITQNKPKNARIEWLESSNNICDFTYVAIVGEILIVNKNVQESLSSFKGIEFYDFEMWQDPTLKRPKRITKRSKKRVWLPYEGPPLKILYVSKMVDADLDKSTIKIENKRTCDECGMHSYEVKGVAEHKMKWDNELMEAKYYKVGRRKGRGIYVHERDLDGCDLFRIWEWPGAILCTERVKELIDGERFTNVLLLEAGEIIK